MNPFLLLFVSGSRNFRQVGEGGQGQIDRKKSDVNSPQLFYRGGPMVYFKEDYDFPRFQGGSPPFSRGGGGLTFPGNPIANSSGKL